MTGSESRIEGLSKPMTMNKILSPIVMSAIAGDKDNSGDGDSDTGIGVATKTRTKTKRPSLYRVLLLNDDFTPQEFVVVVLMDIFNKNSDEAQKIMMHVHVNGVGECGVFPYEVAETKVMLVMDAAQKSQHPLQCVMEKK